jgi:hypothetical protein
MSRKKRSKRKFEIAHVTNLTRGVRRSLDIAGKHIASSAGDVKNGDKMIVKSSNTQQKERRNSSQKSARQEQHWEESSGTATGTVVVNLRDAPINLLTMDGKKYRGVLEGWPFMN